MPVYLATCARFEAGNELPVKLQHVGVEELTAALRSRQYAVILHAGDKVIGVAGNALITQAPLELQSIPKGEGASPGQVFFLDGDSIILAADRNLVVEPQNSRGADGTRLVLGQRDVDDTELWTFVTPAGNPAPPTSGFVKVKNAAELTTALGNGRIGTVVEVDTDRIDLSARLYNGSLRIPSGVTLRGDRRGTRFGPKFFADFPSNSEIAGSMLEIVGDNTTDHRPAPTRSHARCGCDARLLRRRRHQLRGVHRHRRPQRHLRLDGRRCERPRHLQHEGVRTRRQRPVPGSRRSGEPPAEAPHIAQLIHHNRNDKGSGYGVVVGNGGYASIDGNVFLDNRHSLAGDGTTYSGYSAWFNLVLSHATRIGSNNNFQQDFDMHGSIGGYDYPGPARASRSIGTQFLGTNRNNLYLRGEPCSSRTAEAGQVYCPSHGSGGCETRIRKGALLFRRRT